MDSANASPRLIEMWRFSVAPPSRSRRSCRVVAALVTVVGACSTPRAPHGTSLHPWPGDTPLRLALEADGVCRTSDEVVLWFPRGVVAAAQQEAWLARLSNGVRTAKVAVGRPEWAFGGDRRVFFYLVDGKLVSHAPGGNTVYIPVWRMIEDQAPWMHETMHILLASSRGNWLAASEEVQQARMPLWLHEGLAESLAIDVDHELGLAHYSPFSDANVSSLADLCRERLATGPAARVLPVVGARGQLPELYTEERIRYAPTFYTASTSFVRFLQARYGRDVLLHAIDCFGDEIEELERAIGTTLEQAKKDWLASIGYDGPQ